MKLSKVRKQPPSNYFASYQHHLLDYFTARAVPPILPPPRYRGRSCCLTTYSYKYPTDSDYTRTWMPDRCPLFLVTFLGTPQAQALRWLQQKKTESNFTRFLEPSVPCGTMQCCSSRRHVACRGQQHTCRILAVLPIPRMQNPRL